MDFELTEEPSIFKEAIREFTQKEIAAFALTEPNSGSDAASIKTHAKRDGDDYVINGNELPRRKRTRYLSKEVFVLNVAKDGEYNPIRI